MSRGFITPSAPLVETSVPFAPPAIGAEEIADVVATLLAGAVGQGHEVVTTPLTFCATANVVVVHTGATPVFADIDRETFNLDPLAAHAAMTPRTRAILAVPRAGRSGQSATFPAFRALHLHPFYQERFGLRRGMFPAAEAVSDSTLSLPVSAAMTTEAVDRVIEALHDVLG